MIHQRGASISDFALFKEFIDHVFIYFWPIHKHRIGVHCYTRELERERERETERIYLPYQTQPIQLLYHARTTWQNNTTNTKRSEWAYYLAYRHHCLIDVTHGNIQESPAVARAFNVSVVVLTFKVIQGEWFLCNLKVCMPLLISK